MRFLGMFCDIVLEVDQNILVVDLLLMIYVYGGNILKDIFVFDVY